jgi:predicted nicotinamide N-methyase
VTIGRSVHLPWSGREYSIMMPAEFDSLLDQAASDPEQNLPYWAEIWPSGLALADLIEQSPAAFRGRRVIELGCGLGLTATAALRAGALLTVVDYAQAALDLCLLNCRTNANGEPVALAMNWRNAEEVTALASAGRYDVVLAADVLYERRDIDPLLNLIPRLLAPEGVIWLAEPGRPAAAEFLSRVELMGWQRRSMEHRGPWPDESDDGVVVGLHDLRLLY